MPHSFRADIQPFVDRLVRRSHLTKEEQQAVLDLPTSVIQVQANHDFVPLGKRVDHTSLVLAGVVGRFGQNSNGGRQITALHLPGDMADLHSVVEPLAGSALQALSTSTILRVPHDSIREATAPSRRFQRRCGETAW